jgi:hypothetical protein
VFERLNMGSTQLNEQELRNCIYQGSYNTLLEELVLNGYMLLAMHAEVPHKRSAHTDAPQTMSRAPALHWKGRVASCFPE